MTTNITFDTSSVMIRINHPNGKAKYLKFDNDEERYYDERGWLHREDGPALILPTGSDNFGMLKEYYIHGVILNISSDEELIIKLLLE